MGCGEAEERQGRPGDCFRDRDLRLSGRNHPVVGACEVQGTTNHQQYGPSSNVASASSVPVFRLSSPSSIDHLRERDPVSDFLKAMVSVVENPNRISSAGPGNGM